MRDGKRRDINSLHQAFNSARRAGDLGKALDFIDQAIGMSPQDPRNHYMRALTLEDLQRPDEAIASLQDALRLDPDYAEAWNNLGIVLHDQKRFKEAVVRFQHAVRCKPDYARAYNNLGTSLRSLGDLSGAQLQFEQAVRLDPGYTRAYFNLGANCLDLGQLGLAEDSFNRALGLKPDNVEACNNLGHVQRLLGKLDEAQASFTRAAQMKTGNNGAELNSLAKVLWEQGRTDQAIAAYRQAQTLSPYELKAALGSMLLLPAVYHSQGEVLAVRERYSAGLQALHENIPAYIAHNRPEKVLDDLRWSNFYLAYQGLDDKLLQVDYARFAADMLEKIAPQFMQPLAKRPAAGRRLRIGFVSSFFRRSTVGMYFCSWITHMDRGRFETFVYHTRPEHDQVTRGIADASDHFQHLVGSNSLPPNVATRVLQDKLDILIYPELGMDTGSFLLAAMRLAPLQCAGWGHPVTSGHANIDYYFSSASMEPENAAAHYSERLLLLDGIGTHYGKPAIPAAKRRADFALPEGKTLYLCPQSLFKIHPDNDALLARVLERDPDGVLVLFAGRHPNVTNTLFHRLTHALRERGLDPQNRGVILPTVTHDDYLCINMLCDVMLDTLHWSGGNTSLDAIACSLPVVTLPGEFMRGRQSYGMLKLMGLDELIAKDQDDYVEIAVRLGTDRAWRKQVARHISANSDSIFGVETALRQMEQFYVAQFDA